MLRTLRRLTFASAGLVSALVLAAAGCGGDGGGGGAAGGLAGAEFVPAGSPAFVYLNTDFESDTWKSLDALLERFPDLERALSSEGVTLDDIKAALGPETVLGILNFQGDEGNAIALTQPKDKAKLDELIAKLDAADAGGTDTVKEEVAGWTIVSDNQAAIDSAKRAHDGESLADSDLFDEAMGDLSDTALVRFYLDGAALARELDAQTQGAATSLAGGGTLRSIAGEVTAEDDGVGFNVVARTDGGVEPKTYASDLVSQVPGDVLLFASFGGLGDTLKQVSSNEQLQAQLGVIQSALGVSVTELASLFEGEGAVYVRQGAPIPEITVALTVDDEQGALAIVDRLAQRLGAFVGSSAAPEPTKIGDVDAKRLSFGAFAVYYAAFDGRLVLTSATTGISELAGGGGEKLADSDAFGAAVEAAGMPDETAGFLYVNFEAALPLLEGFAQTAGEPLPSEARSNLEPLRSALFFVTAEKGKATVKGFLRIE